LSVFLQVQGNHSEEEKMNEIRREKKASDFSQKEREQWDSSTPKHCEMQFFQILQSIYYYLFMNQSLS